MITEKGTVKTAIVHDENLYKELNKGMRNLGILYIVCGAIIFVLGCVLFGINAYEGTEDSDNKILVIAGLFFLALGIVFLVICRNTAKTALKLNRRQELEFFSDYLLEKGYTEGEHTSTNKIYYKWIVRIKETQNYLFLYNSRMTALAVDKKSLPLNELNTIRALLGRAPQPAPAQSVQPAQNVQAEQSDDKPAEPFADMTDNKEE